MARRPPRVREKPPRRKIWPPSDWEKQYARERARRAAQDLADRRTSYAARKARRRARKKSK